MVHTDYHSSLTVPLSRRLFRYAGEGEVEREEKSRDKDGGRKRWIEGRAQDKRNCISLSRSHIYVHMFIFRNDYPWQCSITYIWQGFQIIGLRNKPTANVDMPCWLHLETPAKMAQWTSERQHLKKWTIVPKVQIPNLSWEMAIFPSDRNWMEEVKIGKKYTLRREIIRYQPICGASVGGWK